LNADTIQAPRTLLWGGGLAGLPVGTLVEAVRLCVYVVNNAFGDSRIVLQVPDSRSQCRAAAESHAQRAAHCVGANLLLSRWGRSPAKSTNGVAEDSREHVNGDLLGAEAYDDVVLCAMVGRGDQLHIHVDSGCTHIY
jgi:hypothetical protein